MPKFHVTVMYNVPHFCTYDVEAKDSFAAEEIAFERANAGEGEFEADFHASKRPDYEIAACELVEEIA